MPIQYSDYLKRRTDLMAAKIQAVYTVKDAGGSTEYAPLSFADTTDLMFQMYDEGYSDGVGDSRPPDPDPYR